MCVCVCMCVCDTHNVDSITQSPLGICVSQLYRCIT